MKYFIGQIERQHLLIQSNEANSASIIAPATEAVTVLVEPTIGRGVVV